MGCCACKTIPDGEAWAVYESNGEIRVIEGPTWVSSACCGRHLHKLDIQVASDSEYLTIKFRDGRTELHPGPCAQVVHPVEHVAVRCESAVQLGDQELLVVYRKEGEGSSGQVRRQLVRGPCLYIPEAVSEWIHEFVWTGPATSSDSINAPARKQIGALRFNKLRTIPGKMYFDVESVRTKDNALITVKLMIFYQLVDVERLLDSTNDPMGDFVNAVSADVIEWCAPKKFDEFLEATDKLNTLEPYGQLKASTAKIGYQVDRIVFRGYSAPPALQKMHDNAIEKRTSLMLSKETEEEEQNMADFKLKKEADRAWEKQKLDKDRLNHELDMNNRKAEAERALQKAALAIEVDRLKQINDLGKKGEMAPYLIAKDCQLPPVVNCSNMMAGQSASGSGIPSLTGLFH